MADPHPPSAATDGEAASIAAAAVAAVAAADVPARPQALAAAGTATGRSQSDGLQERANASPHVDVKTEPASDGK